MDIGAWGATFQRVRHDWSDLAMTLAIKQNLKLAPNSHFQNRMTIKCIVDVTPSRKLGLFPFAINRSLPWPTGVPNYRWPDISLKNNVINHPLILTASIGQGRRNPHPRLFWTDVVLQLMRKQDKEKRLSTDSGLPQSRTAFCVSCTNGKPEPMQSPANAALMRLRYWTHLRKAGQWLGDMCISLARVDIF